MSQLIAKTLRQRNGQLRRVFRSSNHEHNGVWKVAGQSMSILTTDGASRSDDQQEEVFNNNNVRNPIFGLRCSDPGKSLHWKSLHSRDVCRDSSVLSGELPSSFGSKSCFEKDFKPSSERLTMNIKNNPMIEDYSDMTSLLHRPTLQSSLQTLYAWNGSNPRESAILARHTPPMHVLLHRSFSSSSSSSSSQQARTLSGRGVGRTKIPTPHSGPPVEPDITPEVVDQKVKEVVLPAIRSGARVVLDFILNIPSNLWFFIRNPSEAQKKWNEIKSAIKHEVDHYWLGTKLLIADLRTARSLLYRLLNGSALSRRERRQLLRTVSDMFRLIPFSMFVIIPLMEFALPLALQLFPNMLPSTYQDSLKAEENMKRELQSRIAMAKFFQETLEQLATEQKQSANKIKQEIKDAGEEGDEKDTKSLVDKQAASASSMLEFIERARNGEVLDNDIVVQYASCFKDTLTLDNMPRMQLINMCKYMSIAPYGADAFLRFQLRHRMRSIQQDDQRILWEGINSLTKMELREACQERGMRSTGLSKEAYRRALQHWLDLSVNKNIPIAILIMSRTFFLREEMFEPNVDDGSKSLAGLADAISGLDKEIVNEVVMDVATLEEKKSDPEVRKIAYEIVQKQNELIKAEQKEREAAKIEKESTSKKKKMDSKEDIASESESTTGAEGEGTTAAVSAEESSSEAKSEEKSLSTEEMVAISEMVSADPVSRERAELDSIKAAISETTEEMTSEVFSQDPAEPDAVEASAVNANEEPVVLHSTTPTTTEAVVENSGSPEVEPVESEPEDPVVARLKKRVSSMVDKIEVQLSQVQVKIGDKLHVLDKDNDGILTTEEMAEALQQVLKREISVEEAKELAEEIDVNHDGFFTVQELIQWIETNQLVKFVSEGRDADMDRIIEKHSEHQFEEEQKARET